MNKQPVHPIAVVSRRTGLSAHVIRAWEKRYAAVKPARTEGKHRLYTDDDVRRLLLLRDAVKTGRSIGRIAQLQDDELRELIGNASLEHHIPVRPAIPEENNLIIAEHYIDECMESVTGLDSKRLAETLYRASVALGHISVVERVVVPLMEEVGDNWQKGNLRILHEHIASAVVRTFLGDLLQSLDSSKEAPHCIAATMAGDRHELGALTAAVASVLEGWHVEYLGPNLPWEEIARAAELSQSRVVMISTILSSDESRFLGEIEKLRAFLPDHVLILAGGQGPPSLQSRLVRPGIEWIDSMSELRQRLRSLSTG
jgi:DNA-binding transcriptional MerR regulator/methylmalonyl-CoA mutase cobalamin-binding subunit